MALLAGAMCGVRNDSCSRKHKYARTSHVMASESLSRGVDLFFAQEFCFLKQEHGPPRGTKQAKTDVLLTTVLGSLRGGGDSSLSRPPKCSGGIHGRRGHRQLIILLETQRYTTRTMRTWLLSNGNRLRTPCHMAETRSA